MDCELTMKSQTKFCRFKSNASNSRFWLVNTSELVFTAHELKYVFFSLNRSILYSADVLYWRTLNVGPFPLAVSTPYLIFGHCSSSTFLHQSAIFWKWWKNHRSPFKRKFCCRVFIDKTLLQYHYCIMKPLQTKIWSYSFI